MINWNNLEIFFPAISKLIIQVGVSAAADFVDEAHLKQLINDFEDEVFSIEVLELVGHTSINSVKVHALTSFTLLQLLTNKSLELISLVFHLIKILVSLSFQGVEEALLF